MWLMADGNAIPVGFNKCEGRQTCRIDTLYQMFPFTKGITRKENEIINCGDNGFYIDHASNEVFCETCWNTLNPTTKPRVEWHVQSPPPQPSPGTVLPLRLYLY